LDALATAFPEEGSISKLLRFHIYHQAESGVFKPNEAEHWAELFKWRPFAAEPDKKLFDPRELQLWPLGMACRWIERCCIEQPHETASSVDTQDWLDKTWQSIRREWPDFVEQSLCWKENEQGGFSLVNRSFEAAAYVDPEAKQLLLNALRGGTIRSIGISGGLEQKISQARWTTLRIVGRRELDGGDVVVDASANFADASEARLRQYDAVYIYQRDLTAVFPWASTAPAAKRRVHAAEFQRILREESARLGGKPFSQRSAQQLADALEIVVSRQVLREVVSKLWPAPPGRPRKSANL